MVDRKYSVQEIDRMRDAIERNWLPLSGVYHPGERVKEIEDRLRTYMLAGVDPAELQDALCLAWMTEVEARHPGTFPAPAA